MKFLLATHALLWRLTDDVKFGRKPKLMPHQQREARARLEAGETQRSGAHSYNVDQATISRLAA